MPAMTTTIARFPIRLACTLLLTALPALASATPVPTASAPAQQLEGAWRLVSGEFIVEQGQRTDYIAQHVEGIKVIDDGNFAFAITQAGKFWAGGGGTCETDGSNYVESPAMTSFPLIEGGKYRFTYVLDGDTWTLERHQDGKRVELEVWQRVHGPH
jgi:hypothetical protein